MDFKHNFLFKNDEKYLDELMKKGDFSKMNYSFPHVLIIPTLIHFLFRLFWFINHLNWLHLIILMIVWVILLYQRIGLKRVYLPFYKVVLERTSRDLLVHDSAYEKYEVITHD